MNNKEALFELFGIYVGDGCLSVNKRYKELAILGDINEEFEYHKDYVIPLFNKTVFIPLTGKPIEGKHCKTMGVYGIITFEKKVVDYFISFGFKPGPKTNIKLPSIITESDKSLQKHFLRGLFDTDGSIYFEKNYSSKSNKNLRPKIKISTVSRKMKNQILAMLRNFDMNPMDKIPYKGKRDKNINYEIVIHRKKDLESFIKNIGFSSSKHKTKINVWKKLGYCPPKTTISEREKILKQY